MRRLLLPLLVSASLLALWCRDASAAESALRSLAPNEIQAGLRRAGYLVGEPTPWSESVTMLAVWSPDTAPSDRPLLKIFVFENIDAASAEFRRAHVVEEARRNRPIVAGDDRGPQLLTGYGASTWRRNVAVVEASPLEDVGAYPVEPGCDPAPVITATTGLALASREFVLPTTGVDPRFVEILERLPS